MRERLSISLPKEIKKLLDVVAKRDHRNISDIVREAIRKYLLQQKIAEIRRVIIPQARRQGIYTDEDIFRLFS